MENSLSYVKALPTTKEQIKLFTNNVIIELESGNYCPLEIAEQFTAIEKLVKDVKANKRYKEIVRAEAEKFGQRFDFRNSKIELAEVGVKYDYSVCKDEVLNELLSQENQLKAIIKNRQDLLKLGIDASTGEEFIKPIRTSTSSIKITLNK